MKGRNWKSSSPHTPLATGWLHVVCGLQLPCQVQVPGTKTKNISSQIRQGKVRSYDRDKYGPLAPVWLHIVCGLQLPCQVWVRRTQAYKKQCQVKCRDIGLDIILG